MFALQSLHLVAAASLTVFGLLASAQLAGTPSADRVRYDNYQLIEVTPSTAAHLQLLDDLRGSSDSHIFLESTRTLGAPWLVVVAPHKLPEFRALLQQQHIAHVQVLDDLQQAIDAEAHQTARSTAFGWTAYHTLDTIYEWLDQVAIDHAEHVKPIQVGTTHEGRPIRGVHISFDGADNNRKLPNKPGVFIEGGIHAREWISPAFVTYLINELLNGRNQSVRAMAESHEWYIVPSANPDGYVYTHKTNRLWRKTRAPHGRWCNGADPNRNWDFHWNEHSTSSFPCSDIYAGPKAFSEVEMRGYSEYLRSLSGKIQTFVAFHSYSQLLLYPYGHTAQPAKNQADLQKIGEAAVRALAVKYGTKYRVGSIYETIYPASGASCDYVYEVLGVPLAYTYELRPSNGRRGFELPAEEIVPVGEETLDSLVAMLETARELGYNGV